jgi:hypothetical protein
MRFRRAVLQTPPKSSRSPHLPLNINLPLLTPSEATLLHLLIPLHFNSRGCNTYKKTGRGCLFSAAKFRNSLLRTAHQTRHARVAATPFLSSAYAQFPSPMGCTLRVSIHSAQTLPAFSTSSRHPAHSNACNSIPFLRLLHSSPHTRGGFLPTALSSFSAHSASSTIVCSFLSRRLHDR